MQDTPYFKENSFSKKPSENLKDLLKEREDLEIEKLSIKDSIATDEVAMLRFYSYNFQKAEQIKVQLEKKKERLYQIEKKIILLEKNLEPLAHLDEDSKSESEISQEAITSILEKHPESKAAYASLFNQIQTKENVLKELEDLKPYMETFFQPFKEGNEVLASAKKRKFFDCLFGRHPKVILAQKIHDAAKEGEKLHIRLKSLQKGSNTNELYKEWDHFLKNFIEESQKLWNNGLYNQKFLTFFAEAKHLMEKTASQITKIQNDIFSLNNELKKWIEMHL